MCGYKILREKGIPAYLCRGWNGRNVLRALKFGAIGVTNSGRFVFPNLCLVEKYIGEKVSEYPNGDGVFQIGGGGIGGGAAPVWVDEVNLFRLDDREISNIKFDGRRSSPDQIGFKII